MDIVNKKFWPVMLKLFALFHEFLDVYPFCVTNINENACNLKFEVVHLLILSFQTIKPLFDFLKVHMLPLCDFLEGAVALRFFEDGNDALVNLQV